MRLISLSFLNREVKMRFAEERSGNQRKDGDGFQNCLGVSPRCIKERQSKSSKTLNRVRSGKGRSSLGI